jgi:hypothetical protein
MRRATACFLLLLLPSATWAFSTNLHEFRVVRDGVDYFVDTFSDGLEPPQSPAQGPGGVTGCGLACYFTGGTFPDGSEAGDRLRLDTANGISSANAAGTAVFTQRATLSLNAAPTTVTQGLQSQRIFEVSGLFDLTIPATPGSTYSIVLADRTAGNTMNDFVQIQVANAAGTPVIRFRKQDFVADTITNFDADQIFATDGDQVRLILSHPTPDTNTIFASYEFFKGGVSQGIVAMGGSGTIYTGEVWTRPEFLISTLVPEPETYLMMLAGLALVGGMAARRRLVASS